MKATQNVGRVCSASEMGFDFEERCNIQGISGIYCRRFEQQVCMRSMKKSECLDLFEYFSTICLCMIHYILIEWVNYSARRLE